MVIDLNNVKREHKTVVQLSYITLLMYSSHKAELQQTEEYTNSIESTKYVQY